MFTTDNIEPSSHSEHLKAKSFMAVQIVIQPSKTS